MATQHATADTLDLIYRLPETWAVCLAGNADLHIARRVAKLSRHLPADRVGVVDRAVARVIGRESGGRVLAVAEAKIIEADPALHEERVEAERRRRYVSSSRTDEFGLRTVIARVEAGDAVWVEAIVARVAEIIAPRYPDATATSCGRSRSAGWPAPPNSSSSCSSTATSKKSSTSNSQMRRRRAGRRRSRPTCSTRSARPTSSPLTPKATLYVHLHEAAIHGTPAVARVEGLGPVTLTGLQSLLARTSLTVKPVIDLSDRVRSTAYEHPSPSRNASHLTTGGDYWPYRHLHQPPRRLRPPHPPRRQRPTRSDRHPQLRPTGPPTPPLENPRRLPLPTMRPRPLRLADPARTRLPRRPARHPPDQHQARPDDPRSPTRGRHLPGLTARPRPELPLADLVRGDHVVGRRPLGDVAAVDGGGHQVGEQVGGAGEGGDAEAGERGGVVVRRRTGRPRRSGPAGRPPGRRTRRARPTGAAAPRRRRPRRGR